MTRLLGLLVLFGIILPHQLFALPEVKSSFPRLANYFLHWAISDQEAKELAKFDLVILDAEVQERSRVQLEQLRKLNPNIILLAYVPASEIRRDVQTLQTIAPLRYKLGADALDDWYLKDASGNRLSFWPGTWIVDVTPSPVLRTPSPQPTPLPSPNALSQGERGGRGEGEGNLQWDEHLPQFVAREILSTGLWDGVFYDNAWDDIVHFAGKAPDLDKDGIADNPDKARRAWQDGLRAIYRSTTELAPEYLVFENDGPVYAPYVHGVLLENFPRKEWNQHMAELRKVRNDAKDPAVAILNANTFNTGRRDDWRAMRYGFATALISDAFYSFDFGDQDHGQVWWYDEYGVFLGEPLNKAKPWVAHGLALGLWQREFEQGIVFVNSGEQPRTFELAAEVETLRGIQDPLVNDGSITRKLTVGARDGLIVLRPLESIFGAVYENGIFARVFDSRGEPVRAGFFAFDRKEQSGATIARIDLDGDQKMESIRVADAVVQITFGNGHRTRLVPFGEDWQGEISMDFGDVNKDGIIEIVVATEGLSLPRQGQSFSQVRVYRPNGTLLSLPFYPFGIKYKGGINVAIGDLNNDGFSEIIIGAGAGGGPQVRIFDKDGRLLSGGFFAYDPRFRGGVRVAVGDTDGDGNAEIVTGPGVGGGPQVRIFNGKGQPLSSGFFAFDRASRAGVIPIVVDVNGDGKNEILAVTR